jgi:uncharacterized protein (TIGR02246 family)
MTSTLARRVVLVALLACPAAAQTTRPCADVPEYRQLDFWIGEWDVTPTSRPPAAPPARSRIEPVESQCAIAETFTSSSGYSGRSLNTYHPDKKRWEQFWVDNEGALHHYLGSFRDGNLYYEAEGVRPLGATSPLAKVKMTFFNQGRDQVRQLGEQSTDGGRTWTTAYDLTYRRRKAAPGAEDCGGDAGPAPEVKAVAAGIIEADNARDLDRVLDYYARDAVLLPPDGPPVAGRDSIRPRYESLFSSFTPAIESRIDQVCASGTMAFVRGHNAGRMIARGGGSDRPLDDTYLMLLRRDGDGRWRISHLIWH